MGLRADAARDFRLIAGNLAEFGISLELRAPSGQTATLPGLSSDVALAINAETGAAVSARRASVAISTAALDDSGLPRPAPPQSPGATPWKVSIQEPGALAAKVYTVSETIPDASIGAVILVLKDFNGPF